MESLTSGTLAGTGSFRCEQCGYVVTLAAADELPACPGCDGASFVRASLFRRALSPSGWRAADAEREELIAAARDLSPPGEYLAYEDAGAVRGVALKREWTRSGAASPPTSASTTRPSRAATR